MNALDDQISLDSSASDLLLWQVPNEVINGFKVDSFEGAIGVSEAQFKSLVLSFRPLEQGVEIKLGRGQGRILRQALSVVLDELGLDEFDTRTGHAFEEGCAVLKQLDDFLALNKSVAPGEIRRD